MAIVVLVMWITVTGISFMAFPDTDKACKYKDASMTEPRVIGIVVEIKGNIYRTSIYEIDCSKIKK